VTGLRKDGSVVPIDLAIAEWRDSGGTRFFTGIMRDISVRKADEQRKLMLMREVDHRAKNALAVVQSVVRLTSADEPRAFAAAVQARVAALARAHSLLAEGGWAGADLRTLVERELAPVMSSARGARTDVVRLDGPSVALASTVVQPLAMVLHELAANATKHGALTSPGGRVEVSWRIGRRSGEDGVLHLRWAEHDGPTVPDGPRQRGLGMRMAEATVRGQLGGTIMWRWEPSGLICEMGLPLVRVLSGAEEVGKGAGGAADAA
jgi:two-component sensor histidine kinase